MYAPWPTVLGRIAPEDAPSGPESGYSDAYLTKGLVPALEFLKFIQASTGTPLLYPATRRDPQFQGDALLRVVHDVWDFTPELAQAILEENGYEFYEIHTTDGRRLIEVTHTQVRQPWAPEITTVLAGTAETCTASDELLVTLTLRLRHANPTHVQTAVRELLGISGRGFTNTRIVQISGTPTLLVRGKLGVVRHVERIAKAADQLPAKPMLRVVDVHRADAGHVAQVLIRLLRQGEPSETVVVADEPASRVIIKSRDRERLVMLERVIQKLDVSPVRATEAPDAAEDSADK